MDLIALFSRHNYPEKGLPRAWYYYSDHVINLARAAAWFSQWPRTGLELDNFVGAGPFIPIDASHRCHHDHCIVHVVYKGSDTNQLR